MLSSQSTGTKTAIEEPETRDRPVFFMFSGLGAQYVNMGRELYETEPEYQAQVDHSSQLLLSRLGLDLRSVLYPAAGEEAKAERLLGETRLAEPALYVVQYALARLWIHWGVRPQAMIGHSFGEHAAACLAGVLSLEDALALVAERGRLVQTTGAGAMLSVSLPEAEVAPLVGDELCLAAINAPALCAVSGPAAAVEALDRELVARGIECRRLRVHVAAHSQQMDPIVAPFVQEAAKIRLRPPQIPYVSNVTGTWIGDQEATDPAYWGRLLRRTVRFSPGLKELLQQPEAALVEIGPGRTLVTLTNQHPAAAGRLVVASMRHREDQGSDVAFLLTQVDRLRRGGVAVDWEAACAGRPLPAAESGRSAEADAAAHDPIAELLAGIWAQVLDVDRVGVDDNFFDLGGDSLLATGVLSRVGRQLGVEPPQRALFERPTVAGLAAWVAAAQRREQDLEAPPLRAVGRRGHPPLSFAQQRLWFLDRLEPGSALYNVPVLLRLTGPLDRGVLARALNEIVRRHEVLRTTYEEVDGVPVEIIHPPAADLPLPVSELTSLGRPQQQAEADRVARDEARQPFDLVRDLPLRATLVRLGEAEHLLLVTIHHIACDRWTIALLLRELTVLYQAFSAGRASPLPELAVQYADFAIWQRRWLSGEVFETQLSYWREQLADLPRLELPTDRPRPAVQSSRGAQERFLLPPELDRRLRELSRQRGATLFMTLLAAFQTLLGRHTGQDDLAVGSVIAGRGVPEIESLAGFFVNTLVMRGDLCGDPGFGELVARVRNVALGAYAHQDLPFEALVEELEPERSLSQSPLFQVMLVLQTTAVPSRELAPGVAMEREPLDTGTAIFDLDLVLEEHQGTLGGRFEYMTDLFDRTTIRRLARHLCTLLEGLVADPDQPLSQLPLMTAAESHQLLREWSGPAHPDPAGCIHPGLAAEAARRPDAIAVVSPGGRLTYGELEARANQLAAHLRSLGVGPEIVVGLLLERSPEAVVGMLAILKAGGAYLPLDPSYPAERLAFMLDDAGAAMVLTRDRLASLLPAPHPRIVRLDADRPLVAARRRTPAGGAVRAENPAYVIYTSGSTGKPKGVMIAHCGLCRLAAAQIRYYGLGPESRVIQFSSLGFDASVYEIFSTLLAGGTLYLGGAEERMPGPELSAFLRRHAVNTWTVVPSALAAMPDEELPALATLTVAGEACGPELVARWAPGRSFVNAYGPTEVTVCASAGTVTFDLPSIPSQPPIGRAFATSRLYVVDRDLAPRSVGVPGELLIGGGGLARGYLGHPRRTAASFLPDPWSVEAGARTYRSGDLARFCPDGRLEFLGRLDHQVKVRGHRIELGEIEAVLSRHPGVREAVVIAAEPTPAGGPPGDRRLVAYVVRREEARGPEAGELRVYLGERLPQYMVPAGVVFPDSLPTTPSGKADRAALARQGVPAEDGGSEEAWIAPRDPIEEIVAGIWSQVLGDAPARPKGGPSSRRVGVHDNFFAFGGHSLLATRVVSQIRTALGVELPLVRLFEAPTVAGLAARLKELMRAGGERPAPPIARVPRTGDLPLSFAQERLWFLDRYEPDSPLYNVPVAYHLTGRLSWSALAGSLRAVVRRHESLRTTFTEGPRQHVAADFAPDLPLVDLRRLSAAVRQAVAARLATDQARRPFDLAAGPLLRAALLLLDDEEHRLLVTLHHVVCDGWSIDVLAAELAAFYQGMGGGVPPCHKGGLAAGDPRLSLPELPVQYADFAVWQRQWLARTVLEEQLAWWRRRLTGAATTLELPADRPRPPVMTHRGAVGYRPLPGTLGESLKSLGRGQGATLFMTLLAAFFALLHRYTGRQDLLVGTPVANRGRREIEGLIGLFVNTLVLRGDLKGDPGFGELLGRVRAAALRAYTHQDLPFERLVSELRPERDLARSPLFQVMFGMDRAGPQELAPGLPMRPVRVESGNAKFDMALFVVEQEGELVATARYNVDLFDRVTVERLLAHFERLLAGIAAAPERRVSELPLLTRAEEHGLLVEWNDTAVSGNAGECVHELVAVQVAQRPAAVAVTHGSRTLTYGELGRRAELIARQLRRRGVGPDEVVALYVERSPEMLVGMLGILGAGGAYLPLDPDYPAARLTFMLADARARVLLTQERLVPALGKALPEPAPEIIALGKFGNVPAPAPVPDPGWAGGSKRRKSGTGAGAGTGTGLGGAEVKLENLAYVIYTSGSTGRPKGVGIRHSGLTNLVRWHQQRYGVTAADRATQVAGLSFDASVREIWPYLTAGASLHLPDEETRLSPPRLLSWLARRAVTLSWQPTPLVEALVAEPWPPGIALRALLTGGDRLHKRPDFPCALGNHYGPTENTVVTTAGAVRPSASRLPSIGRPIANTAVCVVDRQLRPVPIGVAGELVARGAGLARGYLRRPAPSAERFVPDPWSPAPGARLYRTGDLVRFSPDGRIDFLGRIDHQVKLRGFRIELGEIEEVLGEHPAVAEAVVLAREEAALPARLVAWVVPAAGARPPAAELRRFLAERLPDYMVPACFSLLDELPRLPGGKVDRTALDRRPLPRAEPPEGAGVAPRSPVEEVLAEIWAELLDRNPPASRIGVHDDFFELGGHSLLVTQLVSRIRDLLGVELELRTVFQEPTIAGLAERSESALGTGEAPVAPPIRPLPEGHRDPVPPSFAQQRLWFLAQLEPEAAIYNVPLAWRLTGPLSPAALEASLNEIVRRHAPLHTCLASRREGEPCQVILAPTWFALPVADLAGLATGDRERELRRLAAEEIHRPFDLARGPLLRTALLHLAPSDHLLLVSMHHVGTDGWSIGIFSRELSVLYTFFAGQGPLGAGGISVEEGRGQGRALPLPELPIQYADFARWQRQWLRGEVLAAHLAYWREHLAGLTGALELPTDRPRPPVPSYRGAQRVAALPHGLSDALKALGRDRGATFFMTTLAAFKVLLHRYTGHDDVAVGSFVANRNRSQIEGLIGFFVNTLILRTDLSGQPTFRELLDRVREVALGAYVHQDLPFEKLVEELQPQRDLSRQPLFQVTFVSQNLRPSLPELPEVTVRPLEVASGMAKFDLSLAVSDVAGGLVGTVDYSTDLFDPASIRRFLNHYRSLLEDVVAHPRHRLAECSLLSAAERHQLLVAWNDTEAREPPAECVHELVEAQVARTPEAVAIVCEGVERLTYRELNRRANRLAHRLRARGVGPEVLVGLAMETSVELVVGLLGILKSGGAAVPLDPSYPEERLAFLLADTRIPVLVTCEQYREQLPVGRVGASPLVIRGDRGGIKRPEHTAVTVCLDAEGDPFRRHQDANPRRLADPRNLAYVIHTSGSTGRPKGVAVAHGAIAGHCQAIRRHFDLQPGDRVLQSASFVFDVALEQLFPAFLSGGQLILRGRDLWLPSQLAAKLGELGITVADLAAGYWQQWLEESLAGGGSAEAPQPLRLVSVGGDVMPPEAACRWGRTPLGGVRLLNAYGPTEATITAATFTVPAASPEGTCQHRVPIGRPLANRSLRVLDRHGLPVPIGVPGELCLGGGALLARGYLSRPALTAEHFVPDPFAGPDRAGARLYRTGDLARHRPDGNVDFLGRIDDQVKVRGFRIELGEVEAVLAAAAAPGDRELVACVVGEPAAGIRQLRAFLAERLPPYMLPAAFVSLAALPRLAGGKVDRATLARGLPEVPVREEGFVPPRNPTEELLAAIWEEVLGYDVGGSARIGVDDNFFDLGGHSLLATGVASRASAALGVEVALRLLFEKPTVAALAAEIERLSESRRGTPREPLEPVPRSGPPPLSFAQERLWFLHQLEPQTTAYQATSSLSFQGSLDPEALRRAFDEIVRRHEVLRTTFVFVAEPPASEGPVQRISPPGEHPLPQVDLRRLPPRDRRRELAAVARSEDRRGFDLGRGPLLRTTLVRLGDDDQVLVLCAHHIVFDDWSVAVLLGELGALYQAFAAGLPSPLEPPPIQYADFACWQRRWLRGEALRQELAFWRQRLEALQPVARLAVDRARAGAGTSRAEGLELGLSAATSNALRRLARRQGATLFMTLVAAFQTLLHRHTGAPEVVVGAPTAGRSRHEIEGLIGFFVNLLLVRTDFRGDPTFRQLLDRVREGTLEAYAHQDLPWEKLVEALHPERRAADPQPLFQALFTFQNAPSRSLELPGVTLRPLELEEGRGPRNAMFDLSLVMSDRGEQLAGGLGYDGALFEAPTMEAVRDHFLCLVDEIAADPDRRVGDYALISEAERRQILAQRSRIERVAAVAGNLPGGVKLEAAAGIYLLDRKLGLVPLAGAGEIYLEGIEPAAALRSPATAAASLRPHPFTSEPGSRLFATGVRGRWRSDGRLEAWAEEAPAVADPLAAVRAKVEQQRARLARRRSRLSEARQALLARRLRRQPRQAPPADAIPRRPAQDAVPLSFAQQRLWFFDQFHPGRALYNIPFPVRLTGELDLRVLARGLNEIVRRHEVLRTTVTSVEGRPRQVIASSLRLRLPVVDLGRLPESVREAVTRQLATEEADWPFSLTRGPLLRATVLRLAGREHVILLTMHHIISDGLSMAVLTRELVTLCQAFAAGKSGRALPLGELPIQYADYAVWQRRWLSGEVLAKLLGYWKERLSGAPRRLELSTDRPRPAVQTFRGRSRRFALSPQLSASLARLRRQEKATAFMILLAALTALLARYTGQQDVVVGTSVDGRNRQELEELIGLFVNLLPLRIDFRTPPAARNPTFRQLLALARQVTLDAFAHQELPFDRLVEELQPERDLSSTPLFQVMLAVHSLSAEEPEGPGPTLTPVAGREERTANFDLSWSLEESASGVKGSLRYSTDLFDDSTMARWVAHFGRLLARIVEDPERRLSELPLLSAAETHQILTAWNDSLTARSARAASVPELFAARVEAGPDAVAVVRGRCGVPEEAISYRELNRRADRLGRRLREMGVGPSEVLVGICMERSVEMIVGLLGILKAGGAYLPLDAADPPERLAWVLADGGAAVLLAQPPTVAALPAASLVGVEVLAEWDFAAPGPAAGSTSVSASQLAYVIYTSGSTGRPKGVMVDHGSLVDYLLWVDRELCPDRARSVPLVTSITFDASLKQIFAPLLRGDPVRILGRETVAQPAVLLAALNAGGEEALNCVPSLWEALAAAIESGKAAVPATLGRLLVGGEPLPEDLVKRSRALCPELEITNLYGPTEATANASSAAVTEAGPVTIGRPRANTRLYVLDAQLRPVPIGAAGELAIAGSGLARGYLRRPASTAARFVPNPFGGAVGGRLYRTGDRVRHLADGRVGFLGRLDHQIKLRGFRIELGEIEAALRRSASVRECVVAARGKGGDRRLVAWVVAAPESPAEALTLRGLLHKTLPDYMVPSTFVFLDALPLLPNGKVDRSALPAPERSGLERGYVAPADPAEELLAGIWAEVLGRDRVGVEDDFFELGGHSLLATQVMAAVAQAFRIQLPLSALFQGPTVRRLAAVLRQEGAGRSPLVAIREEGSRPPLFCVHPWGGNVLCFRELARLLGRGQPVYGLQARGLLAGEKPRRRVGEMAAAYLEAVRAVRPRGPYLLLGYSLGGLVAYEMAQQLLADGQSVPLVAILDVRARTGALNPYEGEDDTAILLAALEGEISLSAAELEPLDPDQRLAAILRAGKAAGILRSEFGMEDLRRYVELLHASREAAGAYSPQPYPGRVALFRAGDDLVADETLGWRELVRGELDLYRVPGRHVMMMQSPNVEVLAEQLSQLLARISDV